MAGRTTIAARSREPLPGTVCVDRQICERERERERRERERARERERERREGERREREREREMSSTYVHWGIDAL